MKTERRKFFLKWNDNSPLPLFSALSKLTFLQYYNSRKVTFDVCFHIEKGGFYMANTIITIGRQFGSGGHEIGKIAAKELGIECYDSRLIQMASEKSCIGMEHLKPVDEKRANPWLYTVPSDYSNEMTGFGLPMNDMLFNVQSQVIRQLADRESCIIVGRCADSVLESYPNVISVFIRANMPERIKRITERQNISSREAESLIKKRDKDRSLYYNFFTDKKWGRAESYDIVLNSTTLGVDRCVQIICSLVK